MEYLWENKQEGNKNSSRGDREGGRESSFPQLSLTKCLLSPFLKITHTHTHTAASSCPNNPHGSTCPELCSR